MKNLLITILLALVLFKQNLRAQDSIKISGLIDTSILNAFQTDEIIIRVKEVASKKNNGIVFRAEILNNGTFNITIPTKEKLQYLSFECTSRGKIGHTGGTYNIARTRLGPNLSENYLFEKGDSISIVFRNNDNIDFHGRGSNKLNCQWEIYKTKLFENGAGIRMSNLSLNERDIFEYLKLYKSLVEKQTELRIQLLESYKNDLSKEIYNLLYIDAISISKYSAFEKLEAYLRFPKKYEEIVSLKVLFDYVSGLHYDYKIDSISLNKSSYYTDMILQKYRVESKLHSKDNQVSFLETYKSIVNNYSGYLRDKLLYLTYEQMLSQFYEEATAKQEEALSLIKNIEYYQLTKEIIDHQTKVYPFEFLDQNDRVHSLADFKNKVIVIDFWYTGCEPCVVLSKAMLPIYEQFKNDPNIVFITVGIDRKNIWLASVESGIYTHPGMLNLYAGELRFQHPVLKHYKVNAFPKQLIINKTGNLITSSPPRVDIGEKNVQAFKNILEKLLNE